MLDHRGWAAPARGARLAALTLLTILGAWAWAGAPAAHAETGGLLAFGPFGRPPADTEFFRGTPVAVDHTDGGIFVADVADVDDGRISRLRKFSSTGELKAVVHPGLSNDAGDEPYVDGVAVDATLHRVYVLVVANDHGAAKSLEILQYSTTPDCSGGTCTLPPVGDGVLIDFRDVGDTAGSVDRASGIAVDPDTSKVAVLGVDDSTALDPDGVIQYINSDGSRSTRVTPLGAGLDPDGTTVGNPAGLAIAPGGDVYVETAAPHPASIITGPWPTASVYRLPRETAPATAPLFVQDSSFPQVLPGIVDLSATDTGPWYGAGSPIAVSSDGDTVYLAEVPDATTGRVRGYDTETQKVRLVYGGGTGNCSIDPGGGIAVAAGAGNSAVVTAFAFNQNGRPASVYTFGDSGTGCLHAQAALKVNTSDAGPVTVTKGQAVNFDAGTSELLGGTATQVDWDFDGSGTFATHVTGAPPALTKSFVFTATGDYHVGVKVQIDGAPTTAPAFRDVHVVATTPTASFKVSDSNPAAGGTVTFDAGDSFDLGSTPQNTLKTYHWDFGDGQAKDTSDKTISHAFANANTTPITRTVKLTVTSNDNVTSPAVQRTVTVKGTPATAPPGGGTTNTNTTTTPTPIDKTPKATPSTVTLGSASVDAKGATVSLKLTCSGGTTACAGKVALTTKVKKKVKGKTKTTTVKLGTVTYSVGAGKSTSVKVKLSATGKSLLKKQKKLSVSAALSPTGGSMSTKAFTIKAPAKRK